MYWEVANMVEESFMQCVGQYLGTPLEPTLFHALEAELFRATWKLKASGYLPEAFEFRLGMDTTLGHVKCHLIPGNDYTWDCFLQATAGA